MRHVDAERRRRRLQVLARLAQARARRADRLMAGPEQRRTGRTGGATATTPSRRETPMVFGSP